MNYVPYRFGAVNVIILMLSTNSFFFLLKVNAGNIILPLKN
jgi:hypothetical protein